MNKCKIKRVLALATACIMVFASLTLFNTVQVQAAPGGEVLRATYTSQDASVNIDADLITGDEYTISFWFNGNLGHVMVLWGQWPALYSTIHEEPAPIGEWVYVTYTFTAPEGGFRIQIGYSWYARSADDYFYISPVNIVAANGAVQHFGVNDFTLIWDGAIETEIITLPGEAAPPPADPAPPADAPADPAPPVTVNPLTGETAGHTWLIVSGAGLVAALGVLMLVFKKKK